MLERLKTDILILGSGGAGLFAALHAHQANPALDITVATKGLLGKCGCTRMVQGGYNVALNPGNSVERHFMDTIEGGKWLPHQELAWTLVTKAVERVHELENEVGCFFDRNADGTLHGKAFAGQTFDRTVHKGDLTGIEIINRLMEQVWARPVRRLEEHRAVALIPAKDGQSLAGVLLIDVRTGLFRFVEASAVLLATGGGPTMYRYHTPSGDKSMDGLAMALRAGLPLRDMEMVQFHPTGLLAGPDTRMTGTVLEEGLRGAGGHLLDGAQRAVHGRLRPEARAGHPRCRLARHLCRDARRPHHPQRRRLHQDGASGARQACESSSRAWWSAAPTAASTWPAASWRWCRRRTISWAGSFAGWIPQPSCRAVRRRRGCQRHARRQPAGRQRRRQLDRVRRHRRGDDGRLGGGQCGAPPADEDVIEAEMARAHVPFGRKGGDINRLRESLLDTMWDDVGVIRDAAGLRRGRRSSAPSRPSCLRPACPTATGRST